MDEAELTNAAYTIGWICALEVELAAAQALLDEEHPDLPLEPGDSNVYTLGRIGSHNVAVACLPRSSPGIGSAAVAATNLLRSFPNVRFSLMVGVGGGVPSVSQSDVRLGDVVVSTPTETYGGVIQYDMGKAIQGSPFLRTGSLNRPPDILGAAVAKLSARMRLKGSHAIRQLVDNVIDTYPEAGFTCPGSEHDILFKADYLHKEGQETCMHCETTAIVERKPCTNPGNPTVHHGLIGSANRVLRDAKTRDELGKIGILCVEMEAAGLMNSFPCLVIRGICDYCDSHKNKDWQPYAAIIASAYAKELLANIAAIQVAQIGLAWEVINQKVEHAANIVGKLAAKQEKNESQAILSWLASSDFAGTQQNHIRQRLSGTGNWLLDSPEFKKWVGNKKETLFLHGIPGAGKTVLASAVIESVQEKCLKEKNNGLGYIYLDYNRRAEQNLPSLWAILLRQLLQYTSDIPEEIKRLHAECNKTSERPNLDVLRKAVRLIVAKLTQSFFVVDALDECQEPKSTVLELVSELFELQRTNNINILATSRQIPDIKAMFNHCPMLEICARDNDIEKYIDGSIKNLPTFVMRTENLIEEIKAKIIRSAGGMFLLAKLHTESLYGKRTARELRKALANLGQGEGAYTEAYTQTMRRVCGQIQEQKDLALLVLTYVAYARIPLNISALLHAVAIEIDETGIYEDSIPDKASTISACCGLVVVEHKSQIVRFVHLTAQEFFSGSGADWLENPQTRFTHTCIKYLSLEEFSSGINGNFNDLHRRLVQFPLYQYASWFWGEHAALSDDCVTVVQDFLEKSQNVEAMAEVMAEVTTEVYDWRLYTLSKIRAAMPVGKSIELHLVSAFGLTKMLPQLLHIRDVNAIDRNEQDKLDIQDRSGGAALTLAFHCGNREIAGLLFYHYVDYKSRGDKGRTPISYAAEIDSLDSIRLLKGKGAKCNEPDYEGRTPLSYAAKNNDLVAACLLFSEGIEIDRRDRQGRTPASWATAASDHHMSRLLLDEGGQCDIADNLGCTPLSYAIKSRHSASAKLPLSTLGSTMLATDNKGMNAFHWAAKYAGPDIMELLLQNRSGLDCTSINDDTGMSPLNYALTRHHDELVQILLAHHQKEPEKAVMCVSSSDVTTFLPLCHNLDKSLQEADVYCIVCYEPILESEMVPLWLNTPTDVLWNFKCLLALLGAGCHFATRERVYFSLYWLIHIEGRDKAKLLLETGDVKVSDPDIMDGPDFEYDDDERGNKDNFYFRQLWFEAVLRGPNHVKLLLKHSNTTRSKKAAERSASSLDNSRCFDSTEHQALWSQAVELHSKFLSKAHVSQKYMLHSQSKWYLSTPDAIEFYREWMKKELERILRK